MIKKRLPAEWGEELQHSKEKKHLQPLKTVTKQLHYHKIKVAKVKYRNLGTKTYQKAQVRNKPSIACKT